MGDIIQQFVSLSYTDISICIIVFLLSILLPLISPYFRVLNKVKTYCEDIVINDTLPSLSLIMIIENGNNCYDIEKRIITIISQTYPASYRLIIVADKGNVLIEDLAKKYRENQKLYFIFLPTSSRYMSRRKLAITLAVKASTTNRIILLSPQLTPINEHWLTSFSTYLKNDIEIVLPNVLYVDKTKSFYKFERLKQILYSLNTVKKYRAFSTCVAFRRDTFMKEDGFTGALHLTYGEFDILVNKYSSNQSLITFNHNATLMEDAPDKSDYVKNDLIYLNTKKYLKSGFILRLKMFTDNVALYCSYILPLLTITLALYYSQYIILGVGIVSLITVILLRSIFIYKVQKAVLGKPFVVKSLFLEFISLWRKPINSLRYIFADKYEFTTHKV